MSRKMKDSGVEWIGEIPEDWKITRNKNAFSCQKEEVSDKWAETQLLSLTTKGIKEKNIDSTGGKLPESFNTYQFVHKNDLVMCLFDLDCSAVFSGISPYDGMISPAYKVLSCKRIIEPLYTDYWFKYVFDGRKFNHYSKNIRFTLNYGEFASLPIPVPTIKEQQRITRVLLNKITTIDNIIAKTQASIEEYKRYKQSIITEAVTKGLDPNVPMKDSGIEWIGEIPEHWEIHRLRNVASLRREKSQFYASSDIFVGLENIESFNGKYIETETKYEDGISDVFKKGDVLFSKLRPYLTKVLMPDFDGFCTGELLIFNKFCGNINYLKYLLLSERFIDIVNSSTYGTKMPRATWEFIKNLIIPIPPSDEQAEIMTYLNNKCLTLDSLISKKELLIDNLESYKKSLIYEVVTGKKEVM